MQLCEPQQVTPKYCEMADTVTYTDVRFVKNPKPAERHPPSTDLDGEITYANIKFQRESAVVDSSRSGGDAFLSWWTVLAAHTAHILLGTCLLLVVATVGLGARCSQLSLQLRESMHLLQELRQESWTLNASLYQGIREKDSTRGSLEETQQILHKTQQQLKDTEEKFAESEKKLGDADEMLGTTTNILTDREEHLRRCQHDLKRESDNAKEMSEKYYTGQTSLGRCNSNLEASASGLRRTQEDLSKTNKVLSRNRQLFRIIEQQIRDAKQLLPREEYCIEIPSLIEKFEYCPRGWIMISGKCYLFSERKAQRSTAEQSCSWQTAHLAVIRARDKALQNLIKRTGQEYWFGLEKKEGKWKWPDGSEEDVSSWEGYNGCLKWEAKRSSEWCGASLQWICEKKSSTYMSSMEGL
ncbi:B-cell differentiation antigen CD72-like isoform X2 [Ambystoma mexicanum]|uniref:B-cell differentiation antigen CD72-like isoform X2 n=1 Tax=Ambystoma mexicanum TaxID=8296 RepID=UPI0037E7E628